MDKIYTPFEFFNLPDYLQRKIILEGLDSDSIENLCKAAQKSKSKKAKKFYSNFCKNSEVWRSKIQYEFPSYFKEIERRPFNFWKDEYINLKENVNKYYEDLFRAVLENDLTSVESLLKLGVTPNLWRGGDEKTPLILASQHGYENIVKMLLDAGADVNEKDYDDRTALMGASPHGYENIVKMLLDAGADVNEKDIQDRTALMGASWHGHENIVKMLLAAGADVNAQPGIEDKEQYFAGRGMTALIVASWIGYENIVKILLAAGADVNRRDGDEDTALILASRPGNENIVKMLLAAGADVNAENKNKSSALLEASRERSENIIQELIISGADINAQNYDGNTALMLALQSYLNIGGVDDDDDISIILTILKYKPDPDIRNNRGESALDLAKEYELDIVVNILEYLRNEKQAL